MMNNPVLMNLEKELREEEAKLNQKKSEDKETLAKNVALNAEIKAHEEAIRMKKAEITKLELEIRAEGNEIKKNILAEERIRGEIHSLEQKREADHLKLVKITRENADAVKKSQQEARSHTHTQF